MASAPSALHGTLLSHWARFVPEADQRPRALGKLRWLRRAPAAKGCHTCYGRVLASALVLRVTRRRRQHQVRRRAEQTSGIPDLFSTEHGELPLPIDRWLSEVKLHPDLAQDAKDRFGSVPQQASHVVEDAVSRIEQGARQCVAPSASAHPFGSTVNGFGEASSDLDVLIAVDDEELGYYMSYIHWHQNVQKYRHVLSLRDPAPDNPFSFSDLPMPELASIRPKAAIACAVQQLADFLPELGFRVVRALPHARKPLVTLEDRTGELGDCDVSINNRLPLCNTELLSSYASLDWRVRPLVLLVKVWAKAHGVCGAGEGNLSSYSWTIMVIYFMQLLDLLPSLQKLAKVQRLIPEVDYWGRHREFNGSFMSAEEYLEDVKSGAQKGCMGEAKTTYSLAHLLYGFFRFMAKEYIWDEEVISVRDPVRLRRGVLWNIFGRRHKNVACIHVEDPIEIRDLNIVMRENRLVQLKVELGHAMELLEGGCSLKEFLESAPLPDEMVEPPRRSLRSVASRNRHRAFPLPRLAPKHF
eukprot:TRINITY_DN106539_c0_g1_i1.p1 TRINITY_DN106539_c0_g1~~TRINITY_DN106539_c0_g1_i1.p1  ORF type:complete len:539 (+),score=79.29 TRINITY_DN106539_c0_g1_i1:39-1619(+)